MQFPQESNIQGREKDQMYVKHLLHTRLLGLFDIQTKISGVH